MTLAATLFKHLSLPTDRRPLLTLSPSPEPFPAPKRHKSIRNLRSPSPASDSDQASDADGSGTPPVTAGLVVPSGDDVSASNELSQSIVDLALQDGRTATVTDHAVATIPAGMILTAPSRSLRPVPIDLTDLPDTPPSSVKTLPRIKPEPYSPPSAPRKLPLVKRHSRDDINESSPYRSQAKISLAHAKAHHKYKRGLRFGLNDECWDIAVEVVVHCFSPRYSWFEWNHSGFRDDYLISRRIENKTALEYILNIELIERAFDLPHPKFTAMPRVETIHAINACLKEEWQEASPKSRCTECLDEVRKCKYLADNGKHFDVPCGYINGEGRCTRCGLSAGPAATSKARSWPTWLPISRVISGYTSP